MRWKTEADIISLRIVGRKNMLCITVDELSTFIKSSSELKNLKFIISIIQVKYIKLKGDLRRTN